MFPSIYCLSLLHQESLLNNPYYIVELRMVGLIRRIAKNYMAPVKCWALFSELGESRLTLSAL